ncbi:unnamed protein product [Allacma fusca]|uniref:Leucine-rich repeat-containing protein 51 n=1 Tax=Allacma fusca TaxID=39272 RepID=A0A8J2JRI4_9HEXA|nr:unnamed protein product [Allacma fusca]
MVENMNDIKFFEAERPKIPQTLLDATYDTMKDSARKNRGFGRDSDDEFSASTNSKCCRDGKRKKQERARRKTQEDESEPEELPYRAHGERRLGFLVIGDQHRFGRGGDKSGGHSYLYPDAAPIDFSFCLLSTIEEITASGESPNTKRNYKFPEKTEDERYKTSSVRMSYNLLESIDGLVSVLYKILDGGPLGLCWIDLSFNHIHTLDEDTIGQIPNVKILYLHGNSIADMTEIPKLQGLPILQTLTLHGNPIEEEDGYRACIIYYLPILRHLDFVGVTKGDKANAGKYGLFYEPFWEKRHNELENQAKQAQAAQEMSYTDKIMQEEEEKEEDLDFKTYIINN